jgi:hypothetical protein
MIFREEFVMTEEKGFSFLAHKFSRLTKIMYICTQYFFIAHTTLPVVFQNN